MYIIYEYIIQLYNTQIGYSIRLYAYIYLYNLNKID